MAVIIGSARLGENGHITGGAAGDQTGKEVSTQAFYVHSKGWYVLRPKNATDAAKIAERMRAACNNPNLGYDQNGRYGVIQQGIDTKTPTECDCSSLVRACIKEATGKDVGDFNTSSEADVLEKSGLFEKRVKYSSGMKLCTGDVLVTCVKGHTVIVTDGEGRGSVTEKPATPLVADSAQSRDDTLAGTYEVTATSLNLRQGAGTNRTVITVLSRGTEVACYGYYTAVSGVRWLLVQSGKYTGFVSLRYLKKVR